MKHYIENIGHVSIDVARAKAELGDPRAFVEVPRKQATHKVTLRGAGRQKTYYFTNKDLQA